MLVFRSRERERESFVVAVGRCRICGYSTGNNTSPKVGAKHARGPNREKMQMKNAVREKEGREKQNLYLKYQRSRGGKNER